MPAPRSTAEPSVTTSTFWRVSTSAVGPSWSTTARHAVTVSLASAGRITCSPGIARKRGEVLDRLVGGAVLADADRVVGEHEARLGARHRRQAHGRTHVVEEHEERAADREDPAVRAIPTIAAPIACSRTP
jgi:hypothetical protein